MAVKTADFEAGVLGANVTTGAGEASLTAWEEHFNSFATYDSFTLFGTKSAFFPPGTTTQYGWVTGIGSDIYCRCYAYFPQWPNGTSTITGPLLTGTFGALIGMNAFGQFRLSDGAGALTTSVLGVPTGQWVRLEWHALSSATVGLIEFKLFRNPHSIFPDDVATTPATRNTLVGWNDYRIVGASGFGGGLYIKQLAVNASTYIGPYPKCTSVPLVLGTLSNGSVVTCEGGTWNNGIRGGYYQAIQYHTLTYQWYKDGIIIPGQTGQTYTLASGDINGHYIQCQVTATGIQDTREVASAMSAGVLT